jgi:hypothetical protein
MVFSLMAKTLPNMNSTRQAMRRVYNDISIREVSLFYFAFDGASSRHHVFNHRVATITQPVMFRE